jgi:hypothetical protein
MRFQTENFYFQDIFAKERLLFAAPFPLSTTAE